MFAISGFLNKRNVGVWFFERPDEHGPVAMNSPCFIYWCALPKESAIGPFGFKNENVAGKI